MLTLRAVALQGIGYGQLLVSLQGLAAVGVALLPSIGGRWPIRIPIRRRSDELTLLMLEEDDILIAAAIAAMRSLYESE